jgi:hypothetical protein
MVRQVDKYRIRILEDGIINVNLVGQYDKNDMKGLVKEIMSISGQKTSGRMLVDLKRIKSTSSSARKELVDAVNCEPPPFDKVAICGGCVRNRVMANFIIRASRIEDMIRYFGCQEEALRWLRE